LESPVRKGKIAHLEGTCTKCKTYMVKQMNLQFYEKAPYIICPKCKIPVCMSIIRIEENSENS